MSLSEGLRFQDKKNDREMKDREMRNNEVSRWKERLEKKEPISWKILPREVSVGVLSFIS